LIAYLKSLAKPFIGLSSSKDITVDLFFYSGSLK